jgi:copper(I)-binding protein
VQNGIRRILAALLVLVAACSGSDAPPVVVANVEVTPPRPGAGMSAGYLDITNNSREPLVITHVTSPEFGKVELHETTVEDGVARMRPLDSLVVPPGETVVFERGGKHLMLMRPVDSPDAVTLSLYSGETLLVSVETSLRREP